MPNPTISMLKALKDIGVQLAVDDFGVDPLNTPEPPDSLSGAGDEAGRGYYLKQPMPAEEFRALLEAGTSATATEAPRAFRLWPTAART